MLDSPLIRWNVIKIIEEVLNVKGRSLEILFQYYNTKGLVHRNWNAVRSDQIYLFWLVQSIGVVKICEGERFVSSPCIRWLLQVEPTIIRSTYDWMDSESQKVFKLYDNAHFTSALIGF
jgi:hypothetical protein